MGCSQAGIVSVGTKALDTNVSGNSQISPAVCATSTERAAMPITAPIHRNA